MAPVVEDNWDACLQTLEGHGDLIRAICFSPDGKLLASASDDETIRLWDARTGVTHSVIRDDLSVAVAISFSPDNRLIGSAQWDGTIKLRDLGTHEVCKTFTGHSRMVNAIVFLRNGELLASASDDHTVRLWDTATGLTHFLLQGHTDYVKILAASQDGKYVASGSRDGEIRLWDAVVGERRCVFRSQAPVRAIAFMHNDTTIASAGADGCINFWEVSAGVLENKIDTEEGASKSTFSSDGKRFAVIRKEGHIKLFDTVTGSVLYVFGGHGDVSFALEFSPDNTVLASGNFDHTVKLWDASTGSKYDVNGPSNVYEITVSPLNKLVISRYTDHSMMLWSTHTGRLELEGRAVAFNQNENLVAYACDIHNKVSINLQNLETRAPPLTLAYQAGPVFKLGFSPDNKLLASASSEQTVNLWNVETGALCCKFSCTHEILEVVFSPDGKLLAVVLTNDTVDLWSMITGKLYWKLHITEGLQNVVFSPDGMLLATVSLQSVYHDRLSFNWVYRTWNTTKKDQIEVGSHGVFDKAFAFSPSSRLVVFVSGDGILKLWDVVSGAVNDMLGGANGDCTMVAFSPDGKLIASATYSTINLWDAESRTLVETIAVDSDGPLIVSVSFSQDGRHLKSNLGYHRLQTNGPSRSDDRSFPSIRGDWIFFGTSPFLWLPTDFRPVSSRCSVGIATVALVRPNGHPLIMTFDMTELERLFS